MRQRITIRDGGDEWISVRRRMLQAGCFPALILGAGIPILIVSVIALIRLSSAAVPSRVISIIATGIFLLVGLNLVAAEGLQLVAAAMGARASGSAGGGLRNRLRVVHRKLLPTEISLGMLRLLTYVLLGFALLVAYITDAKATTAVPLSEWGQKLDYLARGIRGFVSVIRPVEAGFLTLMLAVGAHSLVSPFLTVPYSAALGALTRNQADSSGEQVGQAITLRLGVSLTGILVALWGWALLLLIALTIDDASNYLFVPQVLQIVLFRLMKPILTPATTTSVAIVGVILYGLSQVMMARILARAAVVRQDRRMQKPKPKERFAEVLQMIVPDNGGESPS